MTTRYVGQSVRSKEAPRHVTGRGRFTNDYRLPGLLHAAILRTPGAAPVFGMEKLAMTLNEPDPADQLKEWRETVKRLGTGWRDTFIYFKREESGAGPALARELQRLLTG